MLEHIINLFPGVKCPTEDSENQLKFFINKLSYPLLIKLLYFYFELTKRSFDVQLKMLPKFLSNYLDYLEENENFDYDSCYEILEDFYSIFGMIFKFFVNKMVEFLNLRDVDNLNIQNYLLLIFLKNKIVNYFTLNFKKALAFNYDSSSEITKLLVDKIPTLIEKISISSLHNFVLDYEKGLFYSLIFMILSNFFFFWSDFLNTFHKKKLSHLKTCLESEVWTPVDLSFQSSEIIYFLLLRLDSKTIYETILNSQIEQDQELSISTRFEEEKVLKKKILI